VGVEVELQVIGLKPTSFPVTLRREGEVLQTKQVSIEEGVTRYDVVFEFVPKRIGKEIYTVSAPVFEDEALTTNNVGHFMLRVIRDKVRVLQVVGRPSWDERFLRRLLKRNPNVDLISFFILRTNQNIQSVPQDEMSLIPFPTDELFNQELGSFDLVIFQDFNFGPYQMRQYLPKIRNFVVEDGGGFVMVGGELSFASGGYARTPIEEILPVELPPLGARDTVIDDEPFRPQLTEAGLRHPITQLAFDPRENRAIWGKLPEQRGTNIVLAPKEGTTVLATHPQLTYGNEPMPVVAIAERGEGRVMTLTTDSSWRWGFGSLAEGGTPREYQLFWNNTIRWLIKDPELKLVKIELPEDTRAPGDDVQALVRVSNPDYTPAKGVKGELSVSYRALGELLEDPDEQAIEQLAPITFVTTGSGQVEVDLDVTRPGVYALEASVETEAGVFEDQNTLLVVPDVSEFRDIIPREGLMAKVAEATGGTHQLLPSANLSAMRFEAPRVVRVNRRKVIQLWDSGLTFALILLLLGTEWTLRRRWGRL